MWHYLCLDFFFIVRLECSCNRPPLSSSFSLCCSWQSQQQLIIGGSADVKWRPEWPTARRWVGKQHGEEQPWNCSWLALVCENVLLCIILEISREWKMVDWWNNKPPWNEHENSIWLLFLCSSYCSTCLRIVNIFPENFNTNVLPWLQQPLNGQPISLLSSPVHQFIISSVEWFQCLSNAESRRVSGFDFQLWTSRLKGGLIAAEVLGHFRGASPMLLCFPIGFSPSSLRLSRAELLSPTCLQLIQANLLTNLHNHHPPPPLHPTLPSLESPVPVDHHVHLSRVVL